jgi:hypothetical protein
VEKVDDALQLKNLDEDEITQAMQVRAPA